MANQENRCNSKPLPTHTYNFAVDDSLRTPGLEQQLAESSLHGSDGVETVQRAFDGQTQELEQARQEARYWRQEQLRLRAELDEARILSDKKLEESQRQLLEERAQRHVTVKQLKCIPTNEEMAQGFVIGKGVFASMPESTIINDGSSLNAVCNVANRRNSANGAISKQLPIVTEQWRQHVQSGKECPVLTSTNQHVLSYVNKAPQNGCNGRDIYVPQGNGTNVNDTYGNQNNVNYGTHVYNNSGNQNNGTYGVHGNGTYGVHGNGTYGVQNNVTSGVQGNYIHGAQGNDAQGFVGNGGAHSTPYVGGQHNYIHGTFNVQQNGANNVPRGGMDNEQLHHSIGGNFNSSSTPDLFGANQFVYGSARQQSLAPYYRAHKLNDFNGDPQQWPEWINHYYATSAAGRFTDLENSIRLRESLTGPALMMVKGMLMLPCNVNRALVRLEENFGQAHFVIGDVLKQLEDAPFPRDDRPESIVVFSALVDNAVAVIEGMGRLERMARDVNGMTRSGSQLECMCIQNILMSHQNDSHSESVVAVIIMGIHWMNASDLNC